MSPPENLLISSTEFACVNLVIFYLETTDLAMDCEITQIAASATDGEQKFERFSVVPKKNISPGASKVTGLYSHTANGQCGLFKNGEQLDATSALSALTAFIDWLPDNCILLAHNSYKFDMRVLMQALDANALVTLATAKLIGLVDTLPVLKEALKSPDSKPVSHSLGAIYQRFFEAPISKAHDALGDVEALRDVLGKVKPEQKLHVKNSTMVMNGLELTQYAVEKLLREKTLAPKLYPGVISNYMVEKIATSSLSYHHLKLAFSRDRNHGICKLFTEKLENGKVRITSSRRVATALSDHFRQV